MATTISGWKTVNKDPKSGEMAHFREIFTFGTGATDVLGTPFGHGVANTPAPPAGTDFMVVFIQNNTMSTAGDIVVQGRPTANDSFVILKDDHIAYAAASSNAGVTNVARYQLQDGLTPTGPEMPIYRFHLDADGAHSATTGTDKTAEVHILWKLP